MAPHPDDARRVLISDQLLGCTDGIERALVEAKLHLLEVEDAADRISAHLADAVVLDPAGNPEMRFPPAVTALDHLPDRLADLHIAGFFRAVGSALDCLGSTIVGLLGLRTDLLRSGLVRARRVLGKAVEATNPPQLLLDAHARIEDGITGAGPEGWLDWTMDYRNMLVHRARRLELHLPETTAQLYGPRSEKLIRIRVVHLLARDPDRSDIEVLLDVLHPPAFSEAAVVPVLEEGINGHSPGASTEHDLPLRHGWRPSLVRC
jgi:hypothetical protein